MNNKIIFEGESRRYLRSHEILVFRVLLEYFNTDIVCIVPSSHKTPDIKVDDTRWEVKSPKGKDKNTIENILKKAAKQSENTVLDLSRIKMSDDRALSRTRFYLQNNKHCLRRLLVITKDGTVIDLKGLL